MSVRLTRPIVFPDIPGLCTRQWARVRVHPQAKTWLAVLLAAGLVWRVAYCWVLPFNSGDLVRHLLYGRLVWQHGLQIAATPLVAINPAWEVVAWSNQPYNYPAVALFFFTALSAVATSLAWGRLILTLIEALNAWLVYRTTGRRLLAAIYWLSPVSVYWVSHEGQFEPLQNLFTLLALWQLGRRPMLAWGALLLAVQVKLTAVLLLPWFGWQLAQGLRARPWRAGWLPLAFISMVACLPSFIAEQYFPSLRQVFHYSAPLQFSPYYGNIFYQYLAGWVPDWLVVWNHVVTYGLLLVLLLAALRGAVRLSLLAPVAFLLLLMTHHNVQFWYILLWLPFVVPLPDGVLRTMLFVMHPLLELFGLRQMLCPHTQILFGSDVFLDVTPFQELR